MKSQPSVTGIIERTQSFIAHLLGLQEQNERIIAGSNATAQTWDRNAPVCDRHHIPKFRSLVATDTLQFGEYYCSQCEQERSEAMLFQLHTGKIHALFPAPGQLARRLNLSEVRHNMQEDVARGFISCLSTRKELKDAPEVSELATLKPQRPPTSPLPARDIDYAPTPPLEQSANLPTMRASLFADVPHKASFDESDEDCTEPRYVVRKCPTNTARIPAIEAEVLLDELMHGSSCAEQHTGETERIQEDTWLR